ncbi:MAG: hypothetical protein R2697_12375 [Ilumatobacteraceae bacterium]
MPDDETFIGFTTTYPNLTEELRADFDLLDTVLTYHVLDGAMTAAEIMAVTGCRRCRVSRSPSRSSAMPSCSTAARDR